MMQHTPLERQHIASARVYEAIITEVYKSTIPFTSGEPGYGGDTGDDLLFTYDAVSVDSDDVVRVVRVPPHRRIITSTNNADRPTIIAADIGDPCRISVKSGSKRLINVGESYLIEKCEPATPAAQIISRLLRQT